MHFTISNLRDRPQFLDSVAYRVWDFSWRANGYSLEHVATGIRKIVAGDPFPFVLVAHDNDVYVGSSLGIPSDLDERPEYGPWVAAVWVEPEYREQTVGRSLVLHTAQLCFGQGYRSVFLCAQPARHDFYVRQGWAPIEKGVGCKRLTIFSKTAEH